MNISANFHGWSELPDHLLDLVVGKLGLLADRLCFSIVCKSWNCVQKDNEQKRHPRTVLVCNDGVTIQASVVLDATWFSRCLVQYDKPYNPGYQVAYGILAEVEEHPFEVDKMVFMDWRDSHLKNSPEVRDRNSKIPTFLYAMPFSSNRIFLEETSLVARPGLPMKDIQERMVARLKHLGIKVKSIEEDEHCVVCCRCCRPLHPRSPHYYTISTYNL